MKVQILSAVTALAFGLAVPNAIAAPLCPAVGDATDCNIVLTIGPGGSVTSSAGASTSPTYDGIEDVIIGVINNSGAPISSLNLSVPGITAFDFDGDGIDTYGVVKNAGNPDKTGYGGPNGFFTNISSDFTSGTINFITPLSGSGGFDYFSLEEAITFDQIGGSTATPEPGTLLLFGTGALALAGTLRRRVFNR